MMTASETTVVAVFGGYEHETGDPVYEMAEELGMRIAGEGWALLNGGYGGSMEASARGAKRRGGRVIGVTCDIFSRKPNRYVDETLPTRDLWERIRRMLDESDAFLALPGATGTLAEIAMTWEFLCKGFMRPKPLVLVGSFWRPLYDLLVPRPDARAAANGMAACAATPEEAIDILKRLLKE